MSETGQCLTNCSIRLMSGITREAATAGAPLWVLILEALSKVSHGHRRLSKWPRDARRMTSGTIVGNGRYPYSAP